MSEFNKNRLVIEYQMKEEFILLSFRVVKFTNLMNNF